MKYVGDFEVQSVKHGPIDHVSVRMIFCLYSPDDLKRVRHFNMMGESIDCRTVCKIRKEYYQRLPSKSRSNSASASRRKRFTNPQIHKSIIPGNLFRYVEHNVMEDGEVITKELGTFNLE